MSLLLVISVCVPCTADGANRRDFRQAQKVASLYFSPQCSPVHLYWDDIPVDALSGSDCDIALSRESWHWGWAMICTVMTHEYGHLAGFEHTDDPRSIMFPATVFEPRRCKEARPHAKGLPDTGIEWVSPKDF